MQWLTSLELLLILVQVIFPALGQSRMHRSELEQHLQKTLLILRRYMDVLSCTNHISMYFCNKISWILFPEGSNDDVELMFSILDLPSHLFLHLSPRCFMHFFCTWQQKVLTGYLATHVFQYTLHRLRSLNYCHTQTKPNTKTWVDYVRFLNIISMGVNFNRNLMISSWHGTKQRWKQIRKLPWKLKV